jgi:hypothetical protein
MKRKIRPNISINEAKYITGKTQGLVSFDESQPIINFKYNGVGFKLITYRPKYWEDLVKKRGEKSIRHFLESEIEKEFQVIHRLHPRSFHKDQLLVLSALSYFGMNTGFGEVLTKMQNRKITHIVVAETPKKKNWSKEITKIET